MQSLSNLELALGALRRWVGFDLVDIELAAALFLAEKRQTLRYGEPLLHKRTPFLPPTTLPKDHELLRFTNHQLDSLAWSASLFSENRQAAFDKANACPEFKAYLDSLFGGGKLRHIFSDIMFFDTSGWPEAGAELAESIRRCYLDKKMAQQSGCCSSQTQD